MTIKKVTVTTNGSGAATGTTEHMNGLLRRIAYVKTDFADGVDLDFTDHIGTALLSVDDVNASAAWHPKQATHTAAGAAALYAAAGVAVLSDFPIDGPLTVTVASGGSAKVGTFYFWVG